MLAKFWMELIIENGKSGEIMGNKYKENTCVATINSKMILLSSRYACAWKFIVVFSKNL